MAKRGIARPNHVLEIMSKSFIKKGQRLSPDTEFKKGEKPKGTACFKKGHIPHNKGIPFPKHIREKMGRAGPKGEKSHRWKGGYRNLQKERKRILADSYIKILLHHNRIKANEVTPEIIDLKRQAIIGHRTLKQFKKWRSENEQSNS